MTALFNNSVLVIFILCLYCDLLECISFKRHDVHRIVLKSRNRGRTKVPKKSPGVHPVDYRDYNFPKEINYDPYTNYYGESNRIRQEIYHNPHHYNKNRYKNRNPYREYNNYMDYEKPNPNYYENEHFDGYSGRDQYLEDDNKPESSNSFNQAVNYRDFKRYRDMTDYYNKKQQEEYQKEIKKAKKQQKLLEQQHRELSWKDSSETFSQEESIENPVWQSSNSEYFQAVWNPALKDSKQTKRKKNRHNHKPNNIEYIIDMTTSKPQKIPVTIIEESSSEELSNDPKIVSHLSDKSPFTNHKFSTEVNQDIDQSSYEVYEEDSVSPLVGSFQNIAPMKTTYSTLWKQLEEDEIASSKKEKEIRNQYGVRSKSRRFKRPAYAAV